MNTLCRAIFMLSAFLMIGCGNSVDAAEVLPYSVLEQRDISMAGKKRFTYRVEVQTEEIPNARRMRSTAQHIWRNGNQRWDEFTIFFYLPGMNSHGLAYMVAEFSPQGLRELKTYDVALYGTRWRSLEAEIAKADSAWDAESRRPVVGEFKVSLQVQEVSPRVLAVDVETDFPEGTKFLVTASREFHERDNEETYAGELLSRDLAVTAGRIATRFAVDDSDWYSKRKADESKFAGLGIFGEINSISDTLEIEVMFSPRRDQPADVLRLLGRNGELVRGAGAERSGDFTIFRATRAIEVPFRP